MVSVKQYLKKIKPYFGNMIGESKKPEEWKIHLTLIINSTSSKDNDDKQIIHAPSNNIEIMIDNETNGIINKLIGLLLTRY